MKSNLHRSIAVLAGTVALTAVGGALATAQSNGQSITATGCVNRAVNNGSLAGAPGVPPTTPNRAGVLANSNEPTDVILLNGATPPKTASEAATHAGANTLPVSYVLDRSLRDLEPHLGHQVEVTGTVQAVNEGAKDAKTLVNHIKVASIKMIANACPKSASPSQPKK
jgi:hypothetical protein